jgi:hypothetical protein
MRELVARIDCELIDIRSRRATHLERYHPEDYSVGLVRWI